MELLPLSASSPRLLAEDLAAAELGGSCFVSAFRLAGAPIKENAGMQEAATAE